MPLFEYILLVILGAGTTASSGAPPSNTLTADAVVQPNGGALVAAPEPASKDKKVTTASKHRRHRKHRHAGLSPDAITVKQKSK
jgi:hypothetical protein